jgi:hypothetical protein
MVFDGRNYAKNSCSRALGGPTRRLGDGFADTFIAFQPSLFLDASELTAAA